MISIAKGADGPDVRRLQHLLNTTLSPSPKLNLDGSFGAATDSAVRLFQQQRGLPVDGVVGPKTWAALNQMVRAGDPPIESADPTRKQWMDIAIAELGVAELTGAGKHNQRILEYHASTTLHATTDETPWCSSFVNWILLQAGIRGTNSAAARSWLEWGTALTTPRSGAIVVIKSNQSSGNAATGSSSGFHVAFFDSISPTHIKLLGGNQSDRVKYSNFNLASYTIKGYRWP